MYLQRTRYLSQILPYLGKPVIKVLTGMRRSGKSILLEQIIQGQRQEDILSLHREWPEYHGILSDSELTPLLERAISAGKRIICIDEVQLIHHWERSVNAVYAKYRDIDIILTGSNSDLLSGELATLLSGRYIEFQVFPFSFSEYCEFHHISLGEESYKSYMRSTGLPSLYALPSDDVTQRMWVESLKDTIFLKDIATRYAVRDVFLLEELFLWFVNNMGNITNSSQLVKILANRGIKTNHNTVKNYIEYMKRAFLLYDAAMYDLRGKQIFDHERKFYIADHVFRKALFSGYDHGNGKILENLIFMEAISHGYTVFVGRIGDLEVDFVLEKYGKKMYIQVADILIDTDVIEREFRSLRQISDNWPKYVISLDPFSIGTIDGIEHISAWEMEKIFE